MVSNGGSLLRLVVGGLVAAVLPIGLGVGSARAGGVDEQHDVVYAPGVALDVFRPDELTAPAPVVVIVHGGGWQTGSKESWADEARELVAVTGWVAVTVEYDLDAVEPWVTQPGNVRAAIEWVRSNATALGADAERIGLLGSSAGGHLSMLVATTGAPVDVVVSWSGPSDLPLLVASPIGDQLVKDLAARYAGGTLDDVPARWIEQSPVANVDAGDPPMLLVASADETVVPADQLTSMRDVLVAHDVEVETLVLAGTGHASDFADRAWGRTVGFLRDHLED